MTILKENQDNKKKRKVQTLHTYLPISSSHFSRQQDGGWGKGIIFDLWAIVKNGFGHGKGRRLEWGELMVEILSICIRFAVCQHDFPP